MRAILTRLPLAGVSAALLLIALWLLAPGRAAALPAPRPGRPPIVPPTDADVRASRAITDVTCSGGFAGSYPCHNVDLLAFMPFADMNGGTHQANDLWGWQDPQTGREYALFGRTNGTVFVDVTNPTAPVYVAFLPTAATTSSWRDMKVYNNHVFIVADYNTNHGMQVFDLTRLRTVTPGSTLAADYRYAQLSRAHNIAINEATGYAYAIGGETCSGGLHMIDIRNPLQPLFAGCYSADGYTHDVQCVLYNGPDLAYIGREICFAANEDTVTIIDVSDKSAPQLLGRAPGFSNCRAYINCYVHQGWLSEDQAHFLVNDEWDEVSGQAPTTRTYVWDVSDLNNPQATGTYNAAVTSIDHNLYIRGHSAYLANYTSGLRILDVRSIATPSLSESAYFDLFPANDTPSYNGAWSVYPYFASETLIVSHINSGLFVLRANLAADFAMTTDDFVLDACPGVPVAADFNFDALYGYSGDVSLTLNGAPANLSRSWDDATPAVPGSARLTLTNSGAAPGVYRLEVVAGDGTLSQREYMRLNVRSNTVAPLLLAPANGAPVPAEKVSFSWTAAVNADDYLFELATSPLFTPESLVASIVTTQTTAMSNTLSADTQYFWRVTARSQCNSVISEPNVLGVGTPVAVGLAGQPAADAAPARWLLPTLLLALTLVSRRLHQQRQELLRRRR